MTGLNKKEYNINEYERVSDRISEKEIGSWDEKIITINAGTGTGKSYFVKNTLYKYAKEKNKKILMLIHRVNCVEQFRHEVKQDDKQDTIHISTYQSLEHHGGSLRMDEYSYIVSDEFHYFISDATFNTVTDISLNAILNQSKATKIFMSATGDAMNRYFEKKGFEVTKYEFQDKMDIIRKLTFINEDRSMERFAKDCASTGRKAIFFIQSAKKAYELHKAMEEKSIFNCSKSNTDFYKYVRQDVIDKMLKEERFEKTILFTTLALDAGVNIIDTDLKTIVVDVFNVDSLVQCVGRKRMQHHNDNVDLYVRTIFNTQLGGKKKQLLDKISQADFLRTHTVKEYIEKYGREPDKSNIIYDDTVRGNDSLGTKKINELMYFKSTYDIETIDKILCYPGDSGDENKYGYSQYLTDLLGMKSYSVMESMTAKQELEVCLSDLTGRKLHGKERDALAEKVNIKRNRRLLKSPKSINAGLEELGINYRIETGRDWDTDTNSHGSTYWKIERTSDL